MLKNIIKIQVFFRNVKSQMIRNEKGEFGLSSIIAVALGLIVAAFILVPGVKEFASTVITDMKTWWTSTVSNQVFPASK